MEVTSLFQGRAINFNGWRLFDTKNKKRNHGEEQKYNKIQTNKNYKNIFHVGRSLKHFSEEEDW